MSQVDLTEKVIVTLLDQVVAVGGNGLESADTRAVVGLLEDRVAVSRAERGVLEQFLHSPMNAVAQNEFRGWLRTELDDRDFRGRVTVAIRPLLGRFGALPGDGGTSSRSDRRGGGPVPRWAVVLAAGVCLVAVVLWSQQAQTANGPAPQVQTTGTVSSQTQIASGPLPQVQTTGGPVASFTFNVQTGSASGTLSLGTPLPAKRVIAQGAFGRSACSDTTLEQAVAVPFAVTYRLARGSTSGTVALVTNLAPSQGVSAPAEAHQPVEVDETSNGEQCIDAASVEQDPAFMSAGERGQRRGWFVMDRAALAAFDLKIGMQLYGTDAALTISGPRVCQDNLVQLAGSLNAQCGHVPTPTPTSTSTR